MFDRNLLLRVLSAVVALPAVGLLVVWDERWAFAAFAFLMTGIALDEFARMTLQGRGAKERFVLVGGGVTLAVAVYSRPDLALPATMLAVLAVASAQLFFASDMGTAGARFGGSLAGVMYLGLLMTSLPLLQRDVVDGESWVFAAMGVTFSCDTGAYFAGRALGKRKLAPAISPGKTWAGFWGGVLAAVSFVFVAKLTFFPALTLVDVAMVGIGAALLAPAGDLVESLLKRSAGVKDSGNLIPGHGGVLDRVDALVFVSAWVFAYAAFFRGAP
ncbi:MAG: phosphatidate cytidylyltransferase [Myxococcales bacterium]|nr:phosphatidate cytidylyltransferase [Myxococcales bacterium]